MQKKPTQQKHNWGQKVKVEDRTVSYFFRGMRTLWELLGVERPVIGVVILLTILTTALELSFSFFLKQAFDVLPDAVATHTWTVALTAAAVGLVGARVLHIVIWRFVREPIMLKSLIRLENRWPVVAHEKLLALTLGFHEQSNTGRQVAKIQKGVDKLLDIVSNISWGLLHAFLYLVMSTVAILLLDWRLGLIFLIPIVPAVLLNMRIHRQFTPEWEAWEKQKEQASGLFFQSLINIATVQTYAQEGRERANHAAVRTDMEVLDTKLSLRQQRYFFVIGGLLHSFYLVTIVTGIHFVVQGEIGLGTIVFIATTGGVVISSVWEMIHIYTRIMRNLVAAERMKELLDEVPDIIPSAKALIPNKVVGALTLEEVFFAHAGKERETLQSISLTIPHGALVALVGRSGAGKTTLVRLLARVYDVTQGRVQLDGHDIRDLDLAWYRRLFAFVSQDIEVFDTSIRNNVAYAYPNADDALITDALKAAHLGHVIGDVQRFPKGLLTEVGERGVRLSGGERQRVGIARAYVALRTGARVLVLDEATSSLDSESERAIQEMIEGLRDELHFSIVAIAHRLSTVQRADTIVVLDAGRIAEQGTHAQLKKQGGIYAKLVALQGLGEEEEE
jgi:ABC-type multidrug transport system fused ATPase/permease subunit